MPPDDVPAGTSINAGNSCVEGDGSIESATAERLMCTARIQGASSWRALKVRDKGLSQFPGCHATTHHDAHHIVA